MRNRYIYKVTYKPTGQFYIGKRKGKEDCKPEEDFGTYYFTSAAADKNRWIRKSLKENPELWKIEFLHVNVESSKKLAELEIKELKPYFNKSKCINDLCLNKCNPEFSNNIDVSGYRHTDEYKEYMRKINLSENNPFYGKTHSEKSRKLIGKKSKGRRKSEEEKKNQSEFMKKNNPMFNPEHRKKFYESIHSPEYIEKKRQMALGEKNGNYGHHWNNDMKESLSKKKKGLKAYNNGKICVMRKECPEGFVLGTLKRKHKSYNNTEDKMIKSLEIKNVQSHKDSKLVFSPGINALVGTSNNGKSAVLRALMWAITNRPLGTEILLSNWAYDSKGKQNEEMSVIVEKGNSTLIRRKTKTDNEYIINDEVLEAIKTDVPEQVKNFFLLSETNIQKQQDAPFLLSQSSGKIAEYFNRIVRLDIIDKVLSNAESSRRKMKNQLETSEESEKKFEKELEKFEWIDSVEKLIEKIKVLDSKSKELSETKDDLEESVEKFEDASKEKYPDFKKEFKFISQIDEIEENNHRLNIELGQLEGSILKFEEVSKKPFDFSKELKLIEKIENINLNRSEIEELEEQIEKMEYAESFIKAKDILIKNYKKELPEICPYCGAKMKEGKCVEE